MVKCGNAVYNTRCCSGKKENNTVGREYDSQKHLWMGNAKVTPENDRKRFSAKTQSPEARMVRVSGLITTN